MKNEPAKTLSFVGTAAVLAALSGWTWVSNRPPAESPFSDEGQPFFAELETANATPESLEVVAVDAEGKPQQFMVRKKNGVWSIPSHYDYPAEAAERLGKTAAALIGLTRQAVTSRSSADHEKYGVVDPRDPGSSDPEAIGKRIILKAAGDVTLADLIVGREAETAVTRAQGLPQSGRQPAKLHYVRVAGESDVYAIPLELELTTKFADWIKPDLLELANATAIRVKVDRYEIEEEKDALGLTRGLIKVQGDQLEFKRPDAAGQWALEGLDASKEKLQTFKVDGLVRTADALNIRGVRPKFTFQGQQLITPELKFNPLESLRDDPARLQQAVRRLQAELASRGFNVLAKDDAGTELSIVAEQGELEMAFDDGLVYALYLGREVAGDEQSIEIGEAPADLSAEAETAPADGEKPATADGNDKPENDSAAPANPADADDGAAVESSEKTPDETPADKNRYVMIRVVFDESLLPAAPEAPPEPVAPVQPEGYVAKPEAPAPVEGETPPGEPPVDGRDPAFIAYDVQKLQYDEAKSVWEMDKLRYDTDVKERNDKVQAAKDRVAELNERFGVWYYVVSASNLDSLRPSRVDLIEAVEPPPPDPANELPAVPDISFGDQ